MLDQHHQHCWWQNRPNRHGHHHSVTSRNICVTMLDYAVLTKKIHSVSSFECSPEILETMQNQLFNFSLGAFDESFRNFFGGADCPNSDIFSIERMTHLEHNEENFTLFIISENQWIMKYKLINFIYFKKLNLTSKAGLWTDAKSRLRMDGSVRWALKSKRWKWI